MGTRPPSGPYDVTSTDPKGPSKRPPNDSTVQARLDTSQVVITTSLRYTPKELFKDSQKYKYAQAHAGTHSGGPYDVTSINFEEASKPSQNNRAERCAYDITSIDSPQGTVNHLQTHQMSTVVQVRVGIHQGRPYDLTSMHSRTHRKGHRKVISACLAVGGYGINSTNPVETSKPPEHNIQRKRV